ncbi:hypothetical protein [Pontibacter vulgaris]|uniref:hypothetical protein n=1 Tax=Pontibacter vulgaris TaxID=2905679 RepID=UPI001FA809F8|nr:hypothetical protein [Pontibacter vulgaris]
MTRLYFALFAILSFILSLVSACSSDNEEDLDPKPDPLPQQCDTTSVTFSGTVAPILASNCYSCHASAIAQGGVVLDTYAGVKQQADRGNLIGVITHAPGFPPMPQGGNKLSDCNIAKIKKWVDSGALNN